jgi:type II secretory pathway predicted ATPase ExeA
VLRDENGIVKVVGEAGAGKTTLSRQLTRELRDRCTVVYTCDPSLGGEQTWFALADALRLPVDRPDARDAAARVRARIAELHDASAPVRLLVDEARALPGESRVQFRLLAQHGADGERVRIVLLGPDELDHDLAPPAMEALHTRITHSIRLKRLKLADIDEYLHVRVKSVGWSGAPVFDANAVRAIARLSAGIPRRINVIADKALFRGDGPAPPGRRARRRRRGRRDQALAPSRRRTVAPSRRRTVAPSHRRTVAPGHRGTGAPQRSLARAAFAGGIVVAVAIGALACTLLRTDASVPNAAAPSALRATGRSSDAAPAPAASPAPGTAPEAGIAPSTTTLTAAPAASQPPVAAPSGNASAPRNAADLGAAPLTLGDVPAPRFVQDIGPAPTGSN